MTRRATIYCGDALAVLGTLPSESINCCVTSPPFWGLRDYSTGRWDGGDAACDHFKPTAHQKQGATTQRAGRANAEAQRSETFRDLCESCGARRVDEQIGLERTYHEYVARLVEVFEEVRRVLRGDGTLWCNIGDSFATGAGADGSGPGGGAQGERWMKGRDDAKGRGTPKRASGSGDTEKTYYGPVTQPNRMPQPGLKAKDLVGIPWRVAFALQDAGWYLRSDIIWSKPNCMPESVLDRPTRSHEYLFLLAKSARYFYNNEAIREPYEYGRDHHRSRDIPPDSHVPGAPIHTGLRRTANNGDPGLRKSGNRERRFASETTHGTATSGHVGHGFPWKSVADGTRNARSVWTITTQPYKGAHFAAFSPEIPRRAILAGCPTGGLVLDPFAGAGTTLMVAARLERDSIGIELNPAYAEMAANRIRDDAPLLNCVEIVTAGELEVAEAAR